MKDFRQRAFVGLIGLVSAGLLSVGCSSSNNSTGSGGSNGQVGRLAHGRQQRNGHRRQLGRHGRQPAAARTVNACGPAGLPGRPRRLRPT